MERGLEVVNAVGAAGLAPRAQALEQVEVDELVSTAILECEAGPTDKAGIPPLMCPRIADS